MKRPISILLIVFGLLSLGISSCSAFFVFTIPDDPIEFAAKECEELTQNPTKDLESYNNCMDSKMQAMGGMGIFLIFAVFFGFAGIVMLLPGILIFRRQKRLKSVRS